MLMLDEVAPKTDRWWLDRGYVSLTPLKMDMTATDLLSHISDKDLSVL
jgi:broad specificity polyphosphatase/5'/3'-nucleotidase SurE